MSIDFFNLFKGKFRIACFDMDGTLIKGTTSNLFYAKLMGVEEDVIEIEKRLKLGVIGSPEFMVIVSKIMEKLTVDFITENFDLLPIVHDIGKTLEFLKSCNITPIIVTTSNVLFAQEFKKRYGFDSVYGTKHRIGSNGQVFEGIEVCSSDHKINHVTQLADSLGVTMNEVFAVGDSFSDIPIFSKVGCSVAFNYDETLKGNANIYLKSESIYSIIDGIGGYYGN